MSETEATPEWRILDYLCPRVEERIITDDCLRAQLYDVPLYRYQSAINWLESKNYIGYKKEQPTMRSATTEGHRYRNELKRRIDKEKTAASTPWYKSSLFWTVFLGLISAALTWYSIYLTDKSNKLEIQIETLEQQLKGCASE